jgi:hypothetical protein
MGRETRVALLMVVSLCCALAGVRPAAAQQFGRNKVEYQNFDFKVLDTPHFAVYHYASEEETARIAARLAERWYARLSQVLRHELRGRQPLILYASQPEFAQTNVVASFLGEGIGGVTESARRRIVMPFAPTLEETDQILGHEITHAFQMDMASRYRGGLTWPLWAVEGMAQYLSAGPADPETAMWLRDAVASNLLPARQQDAAIRFSPYRYGHALWAYLAGRFGDEVIGDVLKSRPSSAVHRRIRKVTGVELDQLFADWRAAAHERYGVPLESTPAHARRSRASRAKRSPRFHLGPSLSPDGREAVFFSERDRLSLDLFLADAETGAIKRKLATTTTAARFESLQAIRSSGSWSPTGDRFVFAAVERGKPTLAILDMTRRGRDRHIRFPQLGQIFTPTWSPDGRALAFSALQGGATDLYAYDIDADRLRQLTDDPYADLQPAWSPDGERIAFATDRFSSDLPSLAFGRCELATIDLASGVVRAVPAIEGAKHLNPQWGADGDSLYFVSDPDGVSNVYRLDVTSGVVTQVTDVPGGVAGLASTSPALSVARDAPALAYTVYRAGRYEIAYQRGVVELSGQPLARRAAADAVTLPPAERDDGIVARLLADTAFGLPDVAAIAARAYAPDMSLEAVGPPYISSGGGPFGTFVRGGGSLLFGDMLGERKLAMYAQAGNRLRDLALGMRFLNREHRWNWGASAEIQPSLRRLPRSRLTDRDGQPVVSRETHYFERTQVWMAGHLAYPTSQTQRLEFDAGIRHIHYRRSVWSSVRAIESGRLLSRDSIEAPGGAPATVGEASAALVRDTAVHGPTSPIVGARSRFDVTSTFGELAVTRVTADYRRYMMPVKPYTLAARVVHLGQYGRDADDPRMLPTFLGSRQFVRGYGWSSLKCRPDETGLCGAYEELLGSRLLVGNIEVRVPVMGILARELRYGLIPAEAFLFADSGLVWSRSPSFAAASAARSLISSFGAGARVNAFGFPIEVAVVRALDAPARGWSFDLSFRRGF